MRCYICDYASVENNQSGRTQFTVDKDGREVCAHCVRETRKYWVYRGSEGASDASSNIEHQVSELIKRIPDIMNGPSCPDDIPFNCKCTYKTGCLALKIKPLDKDSERV